MSRVLPVRFTRRLSNRIRAIRDRVLRDKFHLRIELPLEVELAFVDVAVGGIAFGLVATAKEVVLCKRKQCSLTLRDMAVEHHTVASTE